MIELFEHYIEELAIDVGRGRLSHREALKVAEYMGRVYALRCFCEALRKLGHPDPDSEILAFLQKARDP